MTKQQRFFELVHEVTEFCLEHQGKCFGGWPKETIFIYVAFHAFWNTIFVVRVNDKVKAIGFVWPTLANRANEPFKWQKPEIGDAILIREVVGSREMCKELYRRTFARWPEVKRFFAYRVRKQEHFLIEFKPGMIGRFCS